jgi:transmembrane sensor
MWMVRNLINFPPRPPADGEDFVAHLDAPAPKAPDEIAEVWDAIGLLGLDAAEAQTPVRDVSRRWVMGGAVAAGLVAAVGAGALWSQRATTWRTPVGGRQTIVLDDGSRVTLNTATVVETRFHGRRRELRLAAGEAYFEVAHRDDRDPFYVTAGAARIRVVGTRFAVRLHDDHRIDIDLLEGHIRTGKAADAKVEHAGVRDLSAGQALRLDAHGDLIAQIPAETQRVQAWLNQRAYFRDTPLTEAVAEMNRYRSRPLIVDDRAADGIRVSGVFDTRNAGDFVAAVHALYGIDIRDGQA